MGVLLLKAALVAIVGYLLGSINSAIIVGKFYGVDIRKHGSGNAGATNTLRTLGKVPALLVALGDPFKGIIACLVGMYVIGNVDNAGNLGVMIGGLSAIIGHNWPIYFGFKGGKGIFTSLAVALMMDWRIALILLGVFLVVVAITRYVSLGSILGSALFPFMALLPVFNKSYVFVAFAAVLGILAILRHRSNIRRLLSGTESKLGEKKT